MGEAATRTTATRAFFGPRAAGWDARFSDDGPDYAAAVAALNPPPAGTALDVACGTAPAAAYLREAVGAEGRVLGIDLTEMLVAAGRARRRALASLIVSDGLALPFPAGTVDVALAAGYLPHLPSAGDGLAELARVVAPGGRLAVFHPIGRRSLAARHGRLPEAGDPLAPPNLVPVLQRTGWQPDLIDDGQSRYLVLAGRR